MISSKIARIDLSRRQIELESFEADVIRKWGGGSGFASWRLYHEVGPGTEPLGPENAVWVIGGPLTGTIAPCSGRVEVVTKSALTGLLGLSNTGGQFGARLKQAGLDGFVLHGASKDPVYILIREGAIEFRDASHLWGRDVWETEELIGAELNDRDLQRIKVMAIGPAGENLVRFACLINERYHAAGRGGAGAVLGAKKVKAIVVDAKPVSLPVSPAFRHAVIRATKKIRDNSTCRDYSRFGSVPTSDVALARGSLSGRNFQTGILPRWQETRGRNAIMSFVTGHEGSCYRCPMPCFNRVEVQEGEYKGLKMTSGTFVQAVFEFGAKCGIESLPAIWKCKEVCHRQGMDYGSAGGAVAFAMELFERGLLTSKDSGGIDLTWGNERAAMKLLMQMAYRQGLGDVLAEGTLRASKALGVASIPYVMTVHDLTSMIRPYQKRARESKDFIFQHCRPTQVESFRKGIKSLELFVQSGLL